MKKLNLKLGGIKEMLTREQMKKITGGHGPLYGYEGNCVIHCKNNGIWTQHPSCGAHTGEVVRHCGYSYESVTWTGGDDCLNGVSLSPPTPWCGPY